MEVINSSTENVEIFIDGREYFALLRPTGMLSSIVADNDVVGTALQLKQFEGGAVLLVIPSCVEAIVKGKPAHAVDDRLRFLVAKWHREQVAPPVSKGS